MSTTAALQKKKHVRAGHRGSATKAIGRAEAQLSSTVPDVDKLSQLKLTLSEKLETLKILDTEILDMVDEGDMVNEIEQADEFKEGVYAILVKIERILSPPPATGSAPVTRALIADPSPSTSGGGRVKLPKLTISPFGGDLTKWMPFWESYCVAIHDNPSLSKTEKFNYLRSLLQHSALDSISGLSLTAANYEEAVAILKKRFGTKQRIVTKHMDALMSIEVVTSSSNLQSLRRLYDNVELHTRSLKSLGVDSNSYGALLASTLMSKLPQDLQLLVSRKIGESEWGLDEVMGVLGEEIQARERTTAVSAKKH